MNKQVKQEIICNKDNLVGDLKVLEMCLNSLFDFTYHPEEKVIFADNNNLTIRFSKLGSKTEMKIIDVKLNKPSSHYKITKQGNFDLYFENYRSLGIDIFRF